jgi:hypothetical protein
MKRLNVDIRSAFAFIAALLLTQFGQNEVQ